MIAAYTGLALPDLRFSLGPRSADAESSPMTDVRDAASMRLCDPFLDALPVTSASVTVFDGVGRQSTVCASDAVAARLDELQFELGVGPQWDALATAHPVLVPALDDDAGAAWIGFTTAALQLGVRATFAFPMLMGIAAVGVVGLSSATSGALNAADVATAMRLTQRTTGPAVLHAIAVAGDHRSTETSGAPAMRREVHQATGMILAHLDVSAAEALFRLRAYAFATSQTLQEVARQVMARQLDFRDLTD